MTRPERIDDEKKSYSAVFLLSVALLLACTVWAVWDDNIARRPWKKYQAEFSRLQIEKVHEELAAEDEKLAADPEYQKSVQELATEEAALGAGEGAGRLATLEANRQAAQVRYDEEELKLRVVKSKMEEGWYEYEHALLAGHSVDEERKRLDVLTAEKAEIEEVVGSAEAARAKVQSEIEEIQSVQKALQEKLSAMKSERKRLELKLDGIVLARMGPIELPKIPKINQFVLNEFDRNAFDQPVARVDRCASCHAAIEKPGFDDEPNPYKTHPDRRAIFGPHPADRFGCTPCHGGQGAAVNSIAQAHGEVRFWEHPLLRGDMVQSSCIHCHTDVHIAGAERIAEGEKLFEELGCIGCHLVGGYGELPRVGPYLRRIAAKADPAWLINWVENPHNFRPHTRMPNFEFNRDQATAIAAYLLQASGEESEVWLGEHPVPTGVDPDDAGLVEKGQQLADSLGCRGCHGFSPGQSPAPLGEDKDIAPNLSRVAEKTDARWLYHWIKDPRGYSPVSKMPSLRLSDEEAGALTSFLLTLGQPKADDPDLRAKLADERQVADGAALVRKYGCAGCHDIPGMQAESRIGVELSTFSSKTREELFFGNRTDLPVTWEAWTFNKLKTPRIYATERIEQVMPQFALGDRDIESLMIFLKSRVEEHVPEDYRPKDLAREETLVRGRRIVNRYNCVGCHVVEGSGGAILANYKDRPTLGPPKLNGEGSKVQPNWLFGFLQEPVPLRPWLKVRMPTFSLSEEETQVLVDYFMAQDEMHNPFVYIDADRFPQQYVEAGRLLATEDYLNCFSCHQEGEKNPEGDEADWAPDLAMAKHRLNPDWVVRWLTDPGAVQPGTKMPSFYDVEDPEPDGPDDVLGGDDREQIKALRDYIFTIGSEASAAVLADTGQAEVLVAETEVVAVEVDEGFAEQAQDAAAKLDTTAVDPASAETVIVTAEDAEVQVAD